VSESNSPLPSNEGHQPTHAGPQRGKKPHRGAIIGIIVVALAIIIAVVAIVLHQKKDDDETSSSAVPAATDITPTARSQASSTSDLPNGCSAKGSAIDPTKVKIESLNIDAKVSAAGVDSKTNAPGVPPLNDPVNFTWYNKSVKPGAPQGMSLLMTHTYHKGGASGNKIHESLKPGDVVRVSSGDKTMCYKVTNQRKIYVDKYSADDAKFVYNKNGTPRIGILICWDWDKNDKEWDSREVYVAEAMYS
jgi:sortase family protein